MVLNYFPSKTIHYHDCKIFHFSVPVTKKPLQLIALAKRKSEAPDCYTPLP